MPDKFKILSVNQLAAKIKIIEVWKIINKEGYPLSLDPYNQNLQALELRPQHNRIESLEMTVDYKNQNSVSI